MSDRFQIKKTAQISPKQRKIVKKVLDKLRPRLYNSVRCLILNSETGTVKTGPPEKAGRCYINENDISAQETPESKGAWLQKENVVKIGQKDFGCKKTQRQKVFVGVMA